MQTVECKAERKSKIPLGSDGLKHTNTFNCSLYHRNNSPINLWWGKFNQKHNHKYVAKWLYLLAMNTITWPYIYSCVFDW